MTQVEQIITLAKQNNGMLSTSMVVKEGLSRGVLKYLVDGNKLEKVARGMYVLPGVFEDEMFVLQNKYKKGIYSLATSLYLWGLTDRTPHEFHMTFPIYYDVNPPCKDGIVCKKASLHLYELGITKVMTPSGSIVNTYNMEKTLVDILRKTNGVDIQVVSEAFKCYVRNKNINLPLLSEYAKELRVIKLLNTYMEVLL